MSFTAPNGTRARTHARYPTFSVREIIMSAVGSQRGGVELLRRMTRSWCKCALRRRVGLPTSMAALVPAKPGSGYRCLVIKLESIMSETSGVLRARRTRGAHERELCRRSWEADVLSRRSFAASSLVRVNLEVLRAGLRRTARAFAP
jgi:hypothetical protein